MVVLGRKSGRSAPVSVMVFTLNEEVHLPGCLESLRWCDDVIVVDSFSTDLTAEIAKQAGARVFQHRFTGFGDQRNWALTSVSPKHPWVLILDADERVPAELAEEFAKVLPEAPESIAAYRIRRRFHMWGRWLRHSSLYPTWVVRLVRVGRVQYVNRGHAETQDVHGSINDLAHDLIDENLKGIDEWFERQNRYSSKDAQYEINQESVPFRLADIVDSDPLMRRAALKRVAAALPARAFIYFLYTYFIRGGFLDGRDGFIFCVMRAMYQNMIEIKKYDARRRAS